MVEADLRILEKQFGVKTDWSSFVEAYHVRSKYSLAMIPSGLDSFIIKNAETPLQKKLAKMTKEHYQNEIDKTLIKLNKFEKDVKDFELKLKNGSKAKDLPDKLEKRKATVQKQKDKISNFKNIEEKGAARIFPNYYAPVIVNVGKDRLIRLMRYHLCPKNGKELNTFKYNLFNARKDRLLDSQIWKPVFGKQHVLFPFYRFYESVTGENGKPKEIYFEPQDQKIMWSAAIYEESKIESGLLCSFAAITDEPPSEVSAAGHDRCPVFLAKDKWDQWMSPNGLKKEELIELLGQVVRANFQNKAA